MGMHVGNERQSIHFALPDIHGCLSRNFFGAMRLCMWQNQKGVAFILSQVLDGIDGLMT